jgi:hypothetical protein
MLRLFALLILLMHFSFLKAQDSVAPGNPVAKDSIVDSLTKQKNSIAPVNISYDSSRNYIIQKLLRLNTQSKPEFVIQQPKQIMSKDWLFYYILGLLLLFGVLRLSYPRYFNDLFRFFFRTSLQVNQIKEQLVQSGLQSLLFNIFFAVSFGCSLGIIKVRYR